MYSFLRAFTGIFIAGSSFTRFCKTCSDKFYYKSSNFPRMSSLKGAFVFVFTIIFSIKLFDLWSLENITQNKITFAWMVDKVTYFIIAKPKNSRAITSSINLSKYNYFVFIHLRVLSRSAERRSLFIANALIKFSSALFLMKSVHFFAFNSGCVSVSGLCTYSLVRNSFIRCTTSL